MERKKELETMFLEIKVQYDDIIEEIMKAGYTSILEIEKGKITCGGGTIASCGVGGKSKELIPDIETLNTQKPAYDQ